MEIVTDRMWHELPAQTQCELLAREVEKVGGEQMEGLDLCWFTGLVRFAWNFTFMTSRKAPRRIKGRDPLFFNAFDDFVLLACKDKIVQK